MAKSLRGAFIFKCVFELLTLSSSEGEEIDDKEFQDMNFRYQKAKDSMGQWFTTHSKQPKVFSSRILEE